MRNTKKAARPFIPSDIQRIITRIERTWTKLTERDIDYYMEGDRHRFLTVLQKKYRFNKEQAEMTLSCIERLA